MSESLTSQDLTTLKEMPCDLEMGELRKITTLQDIPLADGVSMQQLKNSQQKSDEENERKLKTNSLKRFFRLSPKKKFEEGSLDANMEFDEANVGNAESSQKESGQKELAGSFSKASLKSSLNTYWNSVFKQKKFRKSSKTQNQLQSNLTEASSSVNYSENRLPNAAKNPQDNISSPADDDSALDEIQSLKISEECVQK